MFISFEASKTELCTEAMMNLKLQSYDDGEVDGFPLWAMIFYCLRCGDLEATLMLVQQHEHVIQDFSAWFQVSDDKDLP